MNVSGGVRFYSLRYLLSTGYFFLKKLLALFCVFDRVESLKISDALQILIERLVGLRQH